MRSGTLVKVPRRMACRGDDPEEDLDHVHPRCAGWGKCIVIAVLGQPGFTAGAVGGVVVAHDV